MATDVMRYAGFWPRLGAGLLDSVILLPVFPLQYFSAMATKYHWIYYPVFSGALSLLFFIYLVKRLGGTPGKLIMGLRIRKVDGSPVGYREATIRYAPEFLFWLPTGFAMAIAALATPDQIYDRLSFLERDRFVREAAPFWYSPFYVAFQIWFWSELVTMLTNEKRRALHDFLAGTVVVFAESKESAGTAGAQSAT